MRTDRRGARLYYHALAALLFAAVCAWLGAAVFGALAVQDALREETPPAPGRLRGVLLRRERALSPFSAIYWCLVTAGYLAWSFIGGGWYHTWIVWPIAGVAYGAIYGIYGALHRRNG